MKTKIWRTLAEIIGVLSIVAGLMLVAWEIRQANEIARAEVVLTLAEQYNEFNQARFESAEVAELSLMLMRPDDYQLTVIDKSRMSGVAWHFGNIFWSAQVAHDSGLLSRQDLMIYQSQLAWMLEYMPGLAEEFTFMWNSADDMHEAAVFIPLREYVENLPESVQSGD